ncbi:MAG: hypothetical protein HZA28_05185 [Candidatus Omnitrophica bacterium]|nr:hypothetical protein [Candidatus Omnitrophota bacterium]
MNKLLFQITVDLMRKPKAGDLVLLDKRCHFSIGKYSATLKKYFSGVVVKQELVGATRSTAKRN